MCMVYHAKLNEIAGEYEHTEASSYNVCVHKFYAVHHYKTMGYTVYQCTKRITYMYNTSSLIASQKRQYKCHHAHTFSGIGPKNGMAAPIHARQSATNTPNPGMTAHDVNPHSVRPRPKSVMKLFIDVIRALTMRMMHSVVRVSLSRFLGALWGRVVLRACDGEGRWRDSRPTTKTRDNSCCLLSILLSRLKLLSVCRLF